MTLRELQVPFCVVFTKADVRKKGGAGGAANAGAFKRLLLRDWEALPACFMTSSRTGDGVGEVLSYLASLRAFRDKEG